jgi:hypothetical protein
MDASPSREYISFVCDEDDVHGEEGYIRSTTTVATSPGSISAP